MNTNFLRIPMHKLNYIDDLNSFSGLSERELELFFERYEESDVIEIKTAVKWATENKDFDFLSLALDDIKFTNKEIYDYLCKINKSINSQNL